MRLLALIPVNLSDPMTLIVGAGVLFILWRYRANIGAVIARIPFLKNLLGMAADADTLDTDGDGVPDVSARKAAVKMLDDLIAFLLRMGLQAQAQSLQALRNDLQDKVYFMAPPRKLEDEVTALRAELADLAAKKTHAFVVDMSSVKPSPVAAEFVPRTQPMPQAVQQAQQATAAPAATQGGAQ